MSNIFDNIYRKINLNDIEIDLNDYFISSISMEHDTERIYMGRDDSIGRNIIVNHRLTIENDYFEFEILYLDNRDKKEILYLFDIFKQLTKYEIDFRHYDELQKVIEDKYYSDIYKCNEKWKEYDNKKWKICEEIESILRHLQDEFHIESDIEFNKEYFSKKFTIGLQKMS